MTKIPSGFVIQNNTTRKRDAIKYKNKWKRIFGKAIIIYNPKEKRYYIYSYGSDYSKR